jgi:hypothetical protein
VNRLRVRLRDLTAGQDRERGSVSLFVVGAIVAVFAILALVVDGAGQLSALNKAQATAQEAARAGADTVNASQAISGQGIAIDRNAAQAAATAYLAQAGMSGTVSWAADGSIVVDTTQTYTPVLWPTGPHTVTGHASAQLVVQGG